MSLPTDAVVHPTHYNWFGIECMDVVKHFNFVRGNAIKYIWRSGHKGQTVQDELEDLRKAKYYIEIEIAELEKDNPMPAANGGEVTYWFMCTHHGKVPGLFCSKCDPEQIKCSVHGCWHPRSQPCEYCYEEKGQKNAIR